MPSIPYSECRSDLFQIIQLRIHCRLFCLLLQLPQVALALPSTYEAVACTHIAHAHAPMLGIYGPRCEIASNSHGTAKGMRTCLRGTRLTHTSVIIAHTLQLWVGKPMKLCRGGPLSYPGAVDVPYPCPSPLGILAQALRAPVSGSLRPQHDFVLSRFRSC